MDRTDYSILNALTSAQRSMSMPELVALYVKNKATELEAVTGSRKTAGKVIRSKKKRFDHFKNYDPNAFPLCTCSTGQEVSV